MRRYGGIPNLEKAWLYGGKDVKASRKAKYRRRPHTPRPLPARFVQQLQQYRPEADPARYWNWRKRVLQNAAFRCERCGARDVRLDAHHRKAWRTYPSLRYTLQNGQALCRTCHELAEAAKKHTA